MASVSIALRDYVRSSPALWQDVEVENVDGPRVAALATWARPRAGNLRRLRLVLRGSTDGSASGDGSYGDLQMLGSAWSIPWQQRPALATAGGGGGAAAEPRCPWQLCCTALLPQLAGLVSLSLQADGAAAPVLCLGNWALGLVRLRQLRLAAPALELTDAGSALHALTCLALEGRPGALGSKGTLFTSRACLPAALLELHLRNLALPAWPPALAACSALRLLALRHVHRSAPAARASLDMSEVSVAARAGSGLAGN